MNRESLDDLLRLWGWAYGPRRREQEAERLSSAYGDSPIAKFGASSGSALSRAIALRGGKDRRTLLATGAGMEGVVPAWAVPTVSFAETRTGSAKLLSAGDRALPPQAQQIEKLWHQLRREDLHLAKVLRSEFCTLGRQREKAELLDVSLGVYREGLAIAKGWIWGALTEAA